MKKSIIAFCLILLSTYSNSQAIIWEDDFSTQSNWQVINDGTQGDWLYQNVLTQNQLDYLGEFTSPSVDNGFYIFDGVQYLLDGTVNPQDSKLEMVVSANCSGVSSVILEFHQLYRAFISEECWIEVSTDGGTVWSGTYYINEDYPPNGTATSETKRIDISSTASMQSDVRVRFRWIESSDDDDFGSGYGWALDDVKIIENEDNNLSISHARIHQGTKNLEYHFIPESQLSAMTYSAEVANLGGVNQTNVQLNVEVSGTENQLLSSSTSTLNVGENDSINVIGSFTPSAQGQYNLKYWFNSDSIDEVTTDDTIYNSFVVTENSYGRDNGFVTGSISNVSSQPGLSLKIGNVMEVFAPMTINQVSVSLANNALSVGQLMHVEIQKLNISTQAYEFVAWSDDVIVENADLGNFKNIPLAEDLDLEAGDDILVLVGHYGGSDEIAFNLAQRTRDNSVIGYTDDGSSFVLSDPSALMIRVGVANICGTLVAPDFCQLGGNYNDSIVEMSWEAPAVAGIDSFYVYKETSGSSMVKIASIALEDELFVVDSTVNTNDGTYSYAMTILDTCGIEGPMSGLTSNIELTSILNTNSDLKLDWEQYANDDFFYYYIYRGLDAGSMVLYDSVSHVLSSYIDMTPDSNIVQLYYVKPSLGTSCASQINFEITSNLVNSQAFIDFAALYESGDCGNLIAPNFCALGTNFNDSIIEMVWEKPITSGIDSFYVYKDSVDGVMFKVASIAYEDEAIYIDSHVNINTTVYNYAISIFDICGEEGPKSDTLNNMLFFSTITDENNFIMGWSSYTGDGFDYYYIYKGTDPDELFLYDSVSSNENFYMDVNIDSFNVYYYAVEASLDLVCDPSKTSGNYTITSNIISNGTFIDHIESLGLNEISGSTDLIRLSPNPTSDNFRINSSAINGKYDIEVRGIRGELILHLNDVNPNQEISIDHLDVGTYLVVIRNDVLQQTLRLIKM